MKNVRIRVMENCFSNYWWYALCEGRKELMICSLNAGGYERKKNAIRVAKATAKRIGIKFDPEIIKQQSNTDVEV